jgi:surface protein
MAKNNNLTDFLTDVADAIREKEGSANAINPQDFSDRIKALSVGGGDTPTPSRPTWTGHADAEGLRAIGWTEEDIQYYQENGVNWNAEDDQYHLVSEDNKALYGVLTADNIQTYKDRIVYLPKIDTSAKTSMYTMFYNCKSLVAIPHLDTSKVSNMSLMFSDCYSLVSIPHLDTSHVTNMSNMFDNCYSLVSIPHLDTSHVTNMLGMFYSCRSLASIPHLDTSNVKDMSNMLNCCYSLTHINLKNAKLTCELNNSALLSKDSLLYIINNEAAESAITIKLAAYAYTRLAEDADIVAALANHPNISIAQ